MLRSVALAAVIALPLAYAGYSVFWSKDACELFASDVELAVTEPAKAPDPDDDAALEFGSCSVIVTKKFDAQLLGWERHSAHTVAGRAYLGGGDRRQLEATRVALEEERGVRITPLPKLGSEAFLVTRTQPDTAEPSAFGSLPDPAGAVSLPATAHWLSDRYGAHSVSASRDGATVEESQRVTARLAELVDRRPVEMAE